MIFGRRHVCRPRHLGYLMCKTSCFRLFQFHIVRNCLAWFYYCRCHPVILYQIIIDPAKVRGETTMITEGNVAGKFLSACLFFFRLSHTYCSFSSILCTKYCVSIPCRMWKRIKVFSRSRSRRSPPRRSRSRDRDGRRDRDSRRRRDDRDRYRRRKSRSASTASSEEKLVFRYCWTFVGTVNSLRCVVWVFLKSGSCGGFWVFFRFIIEFSAN